MKHTMDEMKETTEQRDGYTVIKIDPGNLVFCDSCGEDWTERTESGGFLFTNHAYCPTCAPINLERIRRYGEQKYIKAVCPPDKSYADWVRQDLR